MGIDGRIFPVSAVPKSDGWLGSSLRAPSTMGLDVGQDWGLADSTPGTRREMPPFEFENWAVIALARHPEPGPGRRVAR